MKNPKSNNRWPMIILGLIFCLAFILRIYNLGGLPFNLQEDEAMTGYVGRFILLNGKDLYGNKFPLLYFDKFGDYYIIMPMYLKGLSTFIFGVNEFAIRFPSALLGSLSIIPIFFIAYWVFNNKKIGYLSAFSMAIMPWHIVLSRASSEGIMGIFFYSLGLMFIIGALKKNKIGFLLSGSLLFFISYFIYHPYRVTVPATIFLTITTAILIKRKNLLVPLIIALVVFSSLTLYIGSTKWGKGRFKQTSIFSPLSGVSIRIQELIFDEGQQKITLARIFHNKILGYGREYLKQYFSYFSGEYLFIKGGQSYAYAIPEHGLLFYSSLLFIILGFISIIKDKYAKNDRIIILLFLTLFLLMPVPASMTYVDAPNIQRSVDVTIFWSIIIGCGLYTVIGLKNKLQYVKYLVIVMLIGEMVYFWHQYAIHSDLFTSIYRNDGQRQVIEYIKNNQSKYKKVFLPTVGTMSMYHLFFTNDFDPAYVGKFKYDVKIDQAKNVYFVDKDCPSEVVSEKDYQEDILIVEKNNCNVNGLKYEQIASLWGKNKLLDFKIIKPKSSL